MQVKKNQMILNLKSQRLPKVILRKIDLIMVVIKIIKVKTIIKTTGEDTKNLILSLMV